MPSSEARKASSAKWRANNREKYLAGARESKQRARADPLKRAKANASSVKSIIKRRTLDAEFKFRENVKTLILMSIRAKGWQKTTKTFELLGCSFAELQQHLTSKFQPGMSWENHGAWHIDHIVPCASAKTIEEFVKLQHYSNLQPLWASDNLKKGAKHASQDL